VTGSEKQLLDDKLHAIMAEEVRYTQLPIIREEKKAFKLYVIILTARYECKDLTYG